MRRVLVTDPISQGGLDILGESGFEVMDLSQGRLDELLDVVGTVHGWIVRSGTRIDAELLNRADNLQVIGRAGVGIDNIDLEAATLRGIVVMNTPDGNTISAVEHTWAVMLSLARHIHLGHQQIQSGRWERQTLRGVELHGKTLGVIGLGRIGREVALRARPFGMNVVGFDPYVPDATFESEQVTTVALTDLLRTSDIVTLHVPLNKSTYDLLGSAELELMKSSALLLNCARGGIVNESALATALNAGTIAGAALDVFEHEPLPPDSPLREAINLLLTPHLGASTKEASERVSLSICRQLVDFLRDGQLQGALNVPVADLVALKKIEDPLQLSRRMGQILQQLSEGRVQTVHITTYGTLTDPQPLALAFLRGLLESVLDARLNYINTPLVAKERGIAYTHSYDNADTGYGNLIRVVVSSDDSRRIMAGSVFGSSHQRIVEIDRFHLEIRPEGHLLFLRNMDKPGVLGKIGRTLGADGVNIGECFISRERSEEMALCVLRVDTDPPDEAIDRLAALPEIFGVRKVTLS